MGLEVVETETVVQTLEPIVGAANVRSWPDLGDRWNGLVERTVAPGTNVACLVSPPTPATLAEILTLTHQRGWPVIPCGAGSKLDWGGYIRPNPALSGSPVILVSTQGLNQLVEHAVGDLTVTVGAGMTFAELQSILARENQFLAIDPAYPDRATIGGIVATADTGSLRQRYNSVRDMLLGISLVRSDGQQVKAGGRVVKNVAGYDLMKLLTGSYGTLAVLTQVTLRVYPLPEAAETVVLHGSAEAIASAGKTLLQSALTPVSVDYLSASLVTALGLGSGLGLAIRFQSSVASVREQVNRMVEVGQVLQLTSAVYGAEAEGALWQRLQEQMTLAPGTDGITCKIGIRPSTAISLLHQMTQMSLPSWTAQIHAASGLGRLTFATSTGLSLANLTNLRATCQQNSGFLTVLQAPLPLKQQFDAWGYAGNALTVMRAIKHQFDPKSLLNPHRFVGGI
jgi:glycolate oxidase FAD binding subunit